jgi:hypothetical protein
MSDLPVSVRDVTARHVGGRFFDRVKMGLLRDEWLARQDGK